MWKLILKIYCKNSLENYHKKDYSLFLLTLYDPGGGGGRSHTMWYNGTVTAVRKLRLVHNISLTLLKPPPPPPPDR